MDAHDILTSAVGNLALLGATAGAFAALRRGQQRQAVEEGICERCKGSGVQECSLCYGRGSIAQPGYVNVANAMHRRLCLRCGGNKTQTCQICGGAYQQGVDARNLLVSRFHERLHSASSTIPEQRADARRRHKRLDEDEFDEF